MEASSPLAAMHRVPVVSWGQPDLFRPLAQAHFIGGGAGSGALSLRGHLHKPKPVGDFFGGADLRGSSPAASLAADLSQNFRLDSESR